MTMIEAQRVLKRIEIDAPYVQVSGYRRYDNDDVTLDLVDSRNGVSFQILSEAHWEERMADARHARDLQSWN